MLEDPYAVLRALLRAEAVRNAPKPSRPHPRPRPETQERQQRQELQHPPKDKGRG